MASDSKMENDYEHFFNENVRIKLMKKEEKIREMILAKDTVEDEYYELRIEPTPENPDKYILRFYPLFWLAQDYEWDKMRDLWEKGYRMFGEGMEEPVCEKIIFPRNGFQRIKRREILFTEMAAICFTCMILRALRRRDARTEWMCTFLEEHAEILKEKQLFADGEILLSIRNAVREMQDGKAYSKWQEKILDEMKERLPKWYDLLLFEEKFWFDISVDCSKKTLGIPSFPLIARRLSEIGRMEENAEKSEEAEDGEIAKAMRVIMINCQVLENAAKTTGCREQEERMKLFWRMEAFFDAQCKEEGREEFLLFIKRLDERLKLSEDAKETGT